MVRGFDVLHIFKLIKYTLANLFPKNIKKVNWRGNI